MAKRKVIWLDERVSDFSDESWDFSPVISKHVDLVICGENLSKGRNRAPTCLDNFSTVLDDIHKSNSVKDIAGFILDVHIPVRNIGRLGNKLKTVTTNNGADTGFQIARYLLRNCEPHLSPYGDSFSEIPILFFSISRFVPSDFTSWMGQDYRPFDPQNFSDYMHLEKDLDETISAEIEKWVLAAIK